MDLIIKIHTQISFLLAKVSNLNKFKTINGLVLLMARKILEVQELEQVIKMLNSLEEICFNKHFLRYKIKDFKMIRLSTYYKFANLLYKSY